jgi:hypothetical protein
MRHLDGKPDMNAAHRMPVFAAGNYFSGIIAVVLANEN